MTNHIRQFWTPTGKTESVNCHKKMKMGSTSGTGGDYDVPSDSDSADSERGFATTNRHVCSVLMHPMGLPLLIHLNDGPSSYSDHHLPYIRDALNNYQQLCTDDVNSRNHVFAATVLIGKTVAK
jgi:hypothetical protein